MSLNQILNDLQSDLDVPEPIHVSTENVKIESKFKVGPNKLDEKVMEKFNTLYTAITTKNNIYPLTKVDYKIAQEVFTMLPEFVNNDQAKVTSYPSTINKDVLEGIFKNITNDTPSDVASFLKDLKDTLNSNMEMIQKVIEYMDTYYESCVFQKQRHETTSPIIMLDKQSMNLFTQPLYNFTYINDDYINYDKYKTVLSDLYRSLVQDDKFQKFLEDNKEVVKNISNWKSSDISLSEMCDIVIFIVPKLKNDYAFFKQYMELLESDTSVVTDKVLRMLDDSGSVVECMNKFKELFDILEEKDNFFDKFKKLLEFID